MTLNLIIVQNDNALCYIVILNFRLCIEKTPLKYKKFKNVFYLTIPLSLDFHLIFLILFIVISFFVLILDNVD